jgi:Leucine-rich repeat (LRR) protein
MDEYMRVYKPLSFFKSFPSAHSITIDGDDWNNESFKLLSNIRKLDIVENSIIDDIALSHLHNIKSLIFYGEISETLSDHCFQYSHFNNLTELDVSNTTFSDFAFVNFKQLQILNASGCSNISNFVFSHFKGIEIYDTLLVYILTPFPYCFFLCMC